LAEQLRRGRSCRIVAGVEISAFFVEGSSTSSPGTGAIRVVLDPTLFEPFDR
jgi:hypothetical protein